MSAGECRRMVVLSDTHFGEEGTLLSSPDTVRAFLTEVEELGEIDLLVLLGDIWDLWKTGLREAHRAGADFFNLLQAWGGVRKTVLVAGNHDAHLVFLFLEDHLRRGLGWKIMPDERRGVDEREGLIQPDTSRDPIAGNILPFPYACSFQVEGLTLDLVYPFLSLGLAGRTVLLMHGHHLDFFSRSFWWAKTAWLARWVLGRSQGIALSDIDRLNRPFFELLTSTASVPEIRQLEYRAYRLLRILARLLRFQTSRGASPRRYTTVGQNASEATELLAGLLTGYIPDLFVFGHTHRAGLERIRIGKREVLLANSGCWVREDDNTPATYLVVDDSVRLRRLADWEISVPWGGSASDSALIVGNDGKPPS